MKITHDRFLIVAAMTLFLLVTGGCSIQEDITRLDLRLASVESTQAELARRLEEDVSRAGQQGDQLRSQYAESNVELSNLKSEINRLNGRIEETEYALDRKLKESQGSRDDGRIEARLRRIETYLDLEPEIPATESRQQDVGGSAGEAKLDVPVPPSAPPADDEESLYQTAKRDFDRGAFEEARNGFQQLLKKYPKAPNADNAQFWIGEIYYREKWYEKAILEYQKVIENYPKGNKVAASLLKQGLAFFNLGDKGNAKLILKELIRKHPQSNEAQIAQQKVKGMD